MPALSTSARSLTHRSALALVLSRRLGLGTPTVPILSSGSALASTTQRPDPRFVHRVPTRR